MRTLAVVALVVLQLAIARAGYCDETWLPAGTIVTPPLNEKTGRRSAPFELDEAHALIHRETIDQANAVAEMSRKLRVELVQCSEALAEERLEDDPEPGWIAGAKWTALGLALGGAFAAGVLVGR